MYLSLFESGPFSYTLDEQPSTVHNVNSPEVTHVLHNRTKLCFQGSVRKQNTNTITNKTINILTAGRLLSEPSHQLVVRELDKRVILLCWKNNTFIRKCMNDSLHIVPHIVFHSFIPASFVVRISSYSSRILSSRSFSSLSQIIPTCLRENKGCSFLKGDEAPEDVPVRRVEITQNR